MAGIGVATPKGDGWEYSLDQTTWQTSRAFSTMPGGIAFIVGNAYVVYCRNIPQNTVAQDTIIFGQIDNSTTLARLKETATPTELSQFLLAMLTAAQQDNDPSTRAKLCELNALCDLTQPPTAPPPTFDQFAHFELIPDAVTPPPVAPAPTVDQFAHFELVPDAVTQPPVAPAPTFDQFAHFELIPDAVTPTGPTITQQVFRGAIGFVEGIPGHANIVNLWSDGTETPYTDGGSFSIQTPYPNGITFTNDAPGQTIISVPDGSLSSSVPGVLQYALSDGRHMEEDITFIDTGSAPAPSIARMSVYLPQGWHDATGGNVSENIVLLVYVANGNGSTPVQARFPGSRNDASFGAMQPIDYSNNPAPNVLPPGYTHYTQFNDEVFTGSLKTFQAKLTSVANSTVEASYLSSASTPDHTTSQIYPATN